jgi:hypothetical protein
MPRKPKAPRLKHVKEPAQDTLTSDGVMQDVIEAVLKNARMKRTFDVPYLGGSSKSGTIYIDRDLPRTFTTKGHRVPADPFIILHEAIERAVGDRLGLSYQHAHQIALRVEEAAVRAAGVSWHDYNAFMQQNIEKAGKDFSKLPPDLDLKPYRDEKDVEMLKRIRQIKRNQNRGAAKL